jgi:DNA-binding NtrC family response regulator
VPVYLPPLRERREDIPALARFFLRRHAEKNRRDTPELTADALKALLAHDWPGNVRELENYMERAVVLANGGPVTPDLLLPPGPGGRGRRWRPLRPGSGGGRDDDLEGQIRQLVRLGIQTLPEGTLKERFLDAVERELIEQVLARCNRVQVTAAKQLGINRNTLHKKVSEYERLDGNPDASQAL